MVPLPSRLGAFARLSSPPTAAILQRFERTKAAHVDLDKAALRKNAEGA